METPLKKFEELLKEWENCVSKGTARLTQIANSNQKMTHADGESWGVLTDANSLHQTLRRKLEREAHQSWKQLDSLVGQLAKTVEKMRVFCLFEVDSEIALDYNGCPTLSKKQYDVVFQRVVTMYQQELMAKSLILHDILDCHDHDTAVLYIASWQMQPYIDKTEQQELLQLLTPPFKRESTQKLMK
ncbi:hypothetical protein LEN26_018513 [Aphanomyces euteiches]|nr:hypothetical protein LEN26_018513 [Aphanomyces euteiches]KAH9127407.1 hypothetical protein AeMF1_002280 [Aphanomyces euteiches]KAH9191557.1 hypothetical protein AeNC1_006456 [Aphanomyces euteiches]